MNKKKVLYLIIFLSNCLFCNQPPNFFESVIVKKNKVTVYFNKGFKDKYLFDDFWVEYDPDINLEKLDYSIVTIPALMHTISMIWVAGETYYIDAMDEDLYYSLQTVREVFKRLWPLTSWNGNLIPRKLVKNEIDTELSAKHHDEIALLFSHGVDSLYSSLSHHEKQLLITIWGNYDIPIHEEKHWHIVKRLVTSFAQQFGHTNTFLRSNFHTFFNNTVLVHLSPEFTHWRLDAVEGLSWSSLVAPILVAKGYQRLCIASGYSWDCPYQRAPNPLIDENIRFAGISIKHDAFNLARVEKNEFIANYRKNNNLKQLCLRVCNKSPNCNQCGGKCLETILSCWAIGENHQDYGFNISRAQAEQKIRAFIASSKINRFVVWYYQMIQKKIRQRLQEKKPVSAFLQWVLTVDFSKMRFDKHLPVKPINWKDFQDLYDKIPERFLK